MVGARSGTRPLIDKLVGPMNLVLPAYGITTELRIAAFLGTAAPECDWFKTLREYGKGAGRKYGKPTGPYGLVYYGRGIFQNTWLPGYQAFTEFVAKNWDWIKPRAAVYKWTVPPDFVKDPELLADPYWAVEAACWYWRANGLAVYADRGIKGFFGLQGLVNRGSAGKRALHYDARLKSYETARRLLPDDFDLNSAAGSPDKANGATSDERADGGSPAEGTPGSSQDQPPTQVPPPTPDSVVVEKEEVLPLHKKIWKKFTGWLAAIGGTASLRQYQEDIATFGIPIEILKYAVLVVLGAGVLWLIYEVLAHAWKYISARWLTVTLVKANTTPTNTVSAACPADLEALEKAGWIVARRG